METLFIQVERSALSLWVRGETDWAMAFPVIICFHAIGMGFMAGIACMVNLRILGYAPQMAPGRLLAFLPVAWLALAINVASGLLLLVGYPTKALTNPVFYIKMLCIGVALWCLFYLRRTVLRAPQPDAVIDTGARRIAALGTFLWVAAIVTGRLLAYTHTRLMSG